MPDITYDWIPVSGGVLDADGMAKNLYRTDANKSVLEIANGRLTQVNFHADFEVLPHHARAGEKGDMWTAGRVVSTDYFSDLSGNDEANYIAVIGTAITFRVKYDVTLAHFHASAFTSVWRQFGPANGAFGTHLAAPEIKVRTFMVDPGGGFVGSTHEYTQREHPQSVFFSATSAGSTADIQMEEAQMCRHHNLMHVRYDGGTGINAQLTRGIYTFGLAILIPQNLFGQVADTAAYPLEDMLLALNGGGADARVLAYYAAIHRCRFYCRNVTGVAWL